MIARVVCAFWLLDHTVTRSPSHAAAAERTSIGTGATRWLRKVRSMTTSHASNGASSNSSGPFGATMLVPASGKSRTSSLTASSTSTTAGSGS